MAAVHEPLSGRACPWSRTVQPLQWKRTPSVSPISCSGTRTSREEWTSCAIITRHGTAAAIPITSREWRIPFGARVIAVADSFDAMTSDWPYCRGMPVQKAADILRDGRGRQWEERVVDAFLRTIAAELQCPAPQSIPSPDATPAVPAPSPFFRSVATRDPATRHSLCKAPDRGRSERQGDSAGAPRAGNRAERKTCGRRRGLPARGHAQ